MPPPPCELLVMPMPSMLDGLHSKLLGYAPVQYVPSFASVNRMVLAGKPASSVGSKGFDGKYTPFPSTVMPAPSRAPISEGSCSCSARLPLRLAVQPMVDSNGMRSTCGLLSVGLKPVQPAPQDAL